MTARTKATDITPKVRAIVMRRDKYCVYCGSHYGLEIAHYKLSRAHGGLGVEENLVVLCQKHHRIYDSGKKEEQQTIRQYVDDYMTHLYGNIPIEKIKYMKCMFLD